MAENKIAESRLRATVRALRHRNFRLFFSGQLVSLIGTWMQTVALSWLVYRLTGSSALLGLVNFASQIPVFLLSPVGGVVADRHSRHRVVIATQTASMLLAFALAGLTLFNVITVWEIFMLSALLGVVNAFGAKIKGAVMRRRLSLGVVADAPAGSLKWRCRRRECQPAETA